jgi:hypothetical protein
MMKLRHKLGKWLVSLGMKTYGELPEKVNATEVKSVLGQPLDDVVEVEDTLEQWGPEQSGNVIIVEPDLMTQHRRGKI